MKTLFLIKKEKKNVEKERKKNLALTLMKLMGKKNEKKNKIQTPFYSNAVCCCCCSGCKHLMQWNSVRAIVCLCRSIHTVSINQYELNYQLIQVCKIIRYEKYQVIFHMNWGHEKKTIHRSNNLIIWMVLYNFEN